MSFPLTPELLASMWDCLRQMPPFCKWKLPPAGMMEFRAPARADVFGEFRAPNTITISASLHGHFDTVFKTLAHEAIHVVQFLDKTENKNQHNADFLRKAKLVCKTFGYDFKGF
jgi:hypothetical protein